MLDDLTPIVIDDFKGLYLRGEDESVPKGFSSDCRNFRFIDKGVQQRYGFPKVWTKANITRIHSIGPSRYLVLVYNSGTGFGDIYDTQDSLTASILNLSGMQDFKVLVANNRYYITPMSNQDFGLVQGSGGFLYVYAGAPATAARKAAGSKPASAIVAATSGTAGNVDSGQHLFAIAYETNTGFITPPNATWTSYVAPGGKKVTISSIPNPGGIYTRIHILGTKKITGYSGNQLDYELFFITSVVMGTTSTDINFYDTSLVSSADYLNDVLEEIPAGSDLVGYRGRLVISGQNLLGTNDYSSLPLVSVSGNYEQFSSVDGFCIVDPADVAEQGVRKGQPYRGTLYFHKYHRSYATIDNGQEPNTWEVVQVDAARGCGSYGVGRVQDSDGNSDDIYLIMNNAGLFAYNGTFNTKPLSYNIQKFWESSGIFGSNATQMEVDAETKSIFIKLYHPTLNKIVILYGDYSRGLTADKIRWCFWEFPWNVQSIALTSFGGGGSSYFLTVSSTANIYNLSTPGFTDDGTAFTASYKHFLARFQADGGINQVDELRISAKNYVPLTAINLDLAYETVENDTGTLPSISVVTTISSFTAPAREYLRQLNLVTEGVAFTLSFLSASNKLGAITKLVVYGSKYADENPQ